MKILLTSHLLGDEPGGTQAWVFSLAKYLSEQGHHVEVRSPDSGFYSEKLLEIGIPNGSSNYIFDLILISYYIPEPRYAGVRLWVQHDSIAKPPAGRFDGYVAISDEAAKLLPSAAPQKVVTNGVSPLDFCRTRQSSAVHRLYSLSQSESLNARLAAICQVNQIEFRCSNKFVNPVLDVRENLEWADLVVGIGRSAYEAAMYGRPVLLLDERAYHGRTLADGMFSEVAREAIAKNCSGRHFRLELTDGEIQRFIAGVGPGDGEASRRLAMELCDVGHKAKQLIAFAEEVENENSQTFWRSYLAERELTSVELAHIEARLTQCEPLHLLFVVDAVASVAGLSETLSSLRFAPSNVSMSIHIVVSENVLLDAPDSFEVHRVPGVAESVSEINCLIASVPCDWLCILRPAEQIVQSGLILAAIQLTSSEPLSALYGDEVCRFPDGRLGGIFRPGFNLDYLLSFPRAMNRHWWFRKETVLKLGGFSPSFSNAYEFDLILRIIEEEGIAVIGHLSEVLLIAPAPELINCEHERAVISRHLLNRGYASNLVTEIGAGRYRVIYNHGHHPLVSIIIPTKNHLEMVRRCVESIFETTAYPHFEVILVDNQSSDPAALEWLAGLESMQEPRMRVLRYPHPFNFAAINNFACDHASGQFLVLLNNDTMIIKSDWLDALLNHALRPEVGVVGCKLLYPDGRVQHGGVVLGLNGPADHPFIGEPLDAQGYMHRLEVDQNYSAVTAACFMVSRDIYRAVGGMDERLFQVSYNDVDFCLKVRDAGYLNVWTPHAILVHEGSVSQTSIDKNKHAEKRKRFVAEQDSMYAKWLPLLARDPAYNANFSLVKQGGFKLADSQLSWRPLDGWRPLPVLLAHPADMFGCGHYRVIQPFNSLIEAGAVEGSLSIGLMHVPDLERYNPDVILLQRQIGEDRLEAMRRMKAFSRAFKVYELDDYLPNLPIKNAHRSHMPKDIVKSLRIGLSYVDRFVVSTTALAEAFSDFHSDIRVMQNRLDPSWWGNLTAPKRQLSTKPRVGWAGGASHTGDLELVYDVVKELAGEVEWVFFGMCPEKLRPYVHEFHAGVPIAQYPRKLAELNLDLAIAPVEQNLFNECKSNLRLLEYGICGFPVICSDVRCYQGNLPVTRVKNRYRDWVDAIRQQLADPDALMNAGDQLRDSVRRDWMLDEKAVSLWQKAWLPD